MSSEIGNDNEMIDKLENLTADERQSLYDRIYTDLVYRWLGFVALLVLLTIIIYLVLTLWQENKCQRTIWKWYKKGKKATEK